LEILASVLAGEYPSAMFLISSKYFQSAAVSADRILIPNLHKVLLVGGNFYLYTRCFKPRTFKTEHYCTQTGTNSIIYVTIQLITQKIIKLALSQLEFYKNESE